MNYHQNMRKLTPRLGANKLTAFTVCQWNAIMQIEAVIFEDWNQVAVFAVSPSDSEVEFIGYQEITLH